MKLRIEAKTPYDVLIKESFGELEAALLPLLRSRRLLVVTDTNVAPLHLTALTEALPSFTLTPYIIKAGEEQKNLKSFGELLSFMAKEGFNRSDAVLALGGGVIGDLAGFTAASYMRGVPLVQCPTTLLAAVDSSVGGKTAVDLPEGKNLVGAFYQPRLTYINLSTLATLPEREVSSGMGEVTKYALLDKSIDEDLLRCGISRELILRSVKIKADIVARDEFDRGERALLNLGHTVGHAVEQLGNYTRSHGACVSIGIEYIIGMSQKYYGLSDATVERLRRLLAYSGNPTECEFGKEALLRQMAHDKKASEGGCDLILIRDVGDCRIVSLKKEEIAELL